MYSLVYNWSKWGLNTTYDRCGAESLGDDVRSSFKYRLLGSKAVSKLHKACMIYNQKVSQIFELSERLQCRGIIVVEYDELVRRKNDVLPRLYEFIDVPYQSAYGDKILTSSLNKADRLSDEESEVITALCGPVYDRAREAFWSEALRDISTRSG